MGGWKRTNPMVYFVSWDDAGIIKVGSSERQRWRRFALRGARIVELVERDYGHESECHAWLRGTYPLAFSTGAEAVPYLGDGDGYLECYRITPGDADAVRAQLHRHMVMHCECNPCRNARTDVRTDLRTDYSPSGEISPYASPANGAQEFDSDLVPS
jgi:hypothetical protein